MHENAALQVGLASPTLSGTCHCPAHVAFLHGIKWLKQSRNQRCGVGPVRSQSAPNFDTFSTLDT